MYTPNSICNFCIADLFPLPKTKATFIQPIIKISRMNRDEAKLQNLDSYRSLFGSDFSGSGSAKCCRFPYLCKQGSECCRMWCPAWCLFLCNNVCKCRGLAWLDVRCPPKLLSHCPPQLDRGKKIQRKAHGSRRSPSFCTDLGVYRAVALSYSHSSLPLQNATMQGFFSS